MSISSLHAPVTVLIADDSSFMRAALSRMVESDDDLRVIGTAQDGMDAIRKIGTLQPDVVTLDIDMPGMSGLETLKRVMAESPRPVIIVSSLARKGAETTLEALQLGAFDCVAKELSYNAADVNKVQGELVSKIKAAAAPRLSTRRQQVAKRNAVQVPAAVAAVPSIPSIIAVGTSTGGPKALQDLLAALPIDLPVPILVVQHMPIGFIGPFAKRLNDACRLKVQEAQQGDTVTPGHVYLAPTGKHMTVRRCSATEVLLHLSPLPGNLQHIPSVDVMMASVAEVYGRSAMGIILTGMGSDGSEGMRAIFRAGGITVGQDQATCAVYGMSRACAEMGVLRQVAALPDIPLHILSALRYRKPQ